MNGIINKKMEGPQCCVRKHSSVVSVRSSRERERAISNLLSTLFITMVERLLSLGASEREKEIDVVQLCINIL